MQKLKIGDKVPELTLEWVKGGPIKLSEQIGKVVVIEVIQVNCAGCFSHGLPTAIGLSRKFPKDQVVVFGVGTAFEDFRVNTLENLKLLMSQNKVVGAPKEALGQLLLPGDMLPYKIEIPMAMDYVEKREITEALIEKNLKANDLYEICSPAGKILMKRRIIEALEENRYIAKLFTEFQLEGTPSTIVIDKKGILRDVRIRDEEELDGIIAKLLKEDVSSRY